MAGVKTLKTKLDRIFSQYIRQRDSIGGRCKCCTCGKLLPWKQMHAGHFISRRFLNIRFDERNVHAQCCGCNTFRNGAPEEYWLFMENKYSRETIDHLIELKREITKLNPSWYEEQILHYKEKLKQFDQ